MQAVSGSRNQEAWRDAYADVIHLQPRWLKTAAPLIAGFSATTDAVHVIDECVFARLLSPSPAPESAALRIALEELRRRVREGRDGEIIVDDDVAADSQLEQIIGPPVRVQCGGTSIQAAWSWAEMGLSPLLALENRTRRQLDATPAGVLVARPDGSVAPVESIAAESRRPVPSNHVLEFPAGLAVDGLVLPRALRVMMIFARKRLQLDPAFADAGAPLLAAAGGGVGLVSGFNGLGEGREQQVPAAVDMVRSWRAAGAGLVHLELADYATRAELARILVLTAGTIDSIGMNASEFEALIHNGDDLATEAGAFADASGFSRVVIHGDRWAMSVHRRDPEVESLALRAGSLAAANRAAGVGPERRWRLPHGAEFSADVPADRVLPTGRRVTAVATPFLAAPRSTIGLGDTFVSGDLLVQASRR